MGGGLEKQMGSAPINGIDLYFETKGMGKPLVLLHAGVADSRMWDSQFDELAKNYGCISDTVSTNVRNLSGQR